MITTRTVPAPLPTHNRRVAHPPTVRKDFADPLRARGDLQSAGRCRRRPGPAPAAHRCPRHISDLLVTPDRRMASSLSGVTREMEQYLETPGSSGVGGALTTRRRFRRSPGQTYTKVR